MMSELLRQIDAYASAAISREQFELWFYDLSFDVEQKHSELTVALVHEVEGLLAEASSGGWKEEELLNDLTSATTACRGVLVA